jgi:hypothetical protein
MAAATLAPGPAVGPVGAIHVHSDYSHDGRDPLSRVRDWAAATGTRFVLMTDHAEDFDAARFAEYRAACAALSDGQVALIPGLEFRFKGYRGLHLLACGLDTWAAPVSLDAFVRDVGPHARLTILAHPLLSGYMVPAGLHGSIDAIEVWNAAYNTRYLPDPRAILLLRAVRRARPTTFGVAGLDQHDAANDRQTRVVLRDAADLADPLAAIRDGRFTNRGKTMSFGAEVEWPIAGLAALFVVRVVFDGIERTQEHITRAWRRCTARTASE